MAVTKRSTKGSALTHGEMDANWDELLGLLTRLGVFIASQSPGASQIPVKNSANNLVLPSGSVLFGGSTFTNGLAPIFEARGLSVLSLLTGNTSGAPGIAWVKAISSGDMVDGFGGLLVFTIEDTAGVHNNIGHIGCVRKGADNSGDMKFTTYSNGNTTEVMRLTATARMLLGTLNDDGVNKLQVVGSVASVMNNGNQYARLRHDTANAILDVGFGLLVIRGNSSGTADSVIFQTGVANSERARILGNGHLLVGTSTDNASGAKLQVSDGVTFPASQVASADPNTLDDYEEGTWTPVLSGTVTAGVGTYSPAPAGSYIKIGKLVRINCRIFWTAHTGTGDFTITGLPYVSTGVTCSMSIYSNSLAIGAGKQITVILSLGVSALVLKAIDLAGGATGNIPVAGTGDFAITGTYEV